MKHRLDHKLKLVKNDDVPFRVHEYDVDTDSNQIYLMGTDSRATGEAVEANFGEPGVEYTMANRFIRNLNICMRANPDKPILVHMKTCGGYWEEGMAVFDAIRTCPSKVTILNYTWARSMSSLIFLAANKRVMMPHAWFMFHMGSAEFSGTAKQLDTEAEREKVLIARMIEHYVDALKEQGSMSRWSRARLRQWLKAQMDKKEDVFLEADQAVTVGFADEIFNGDWPSLIKYSPRQKRRKVGAA
jgi:ATP-dependent protease ClpP protease subunit